MSKVETPATKNVNQGAEQTLEAGSRPQARVAIRPVPKWENAARDRLRGAVKKFTKPLADLVARDANEGDTRLLITDFLCEGLGFDKYEDLTTEYEVKGGFADYGVRIDKQLVAFIEVKRVTTKLDSKHLRQVETYAVKEGVEWAILTNGVEWRVYHLSDKIPVQTDFALEANLLSEENLQHKTNQLFYLTKEALKRRELDELWKAKRATSPKSLAQVISSEQVLEAIRKELKRQTGHNMQANEIADLLKKNALRLECFE